eukprot:m.464 g.464  ORF g.464 m.464 type:complete len:67 (-) comp396_c0_seq1:17-217(-)
MDAYTVISFDICVADCVDLWICDILHACVYACMNVNVNVGGRAKISNQTASDRLVQSCHAVIDEQD